MKTPLVLRNVPSTIDLTTSRDVATPVPVPAAPGQGRLVARAALSVAVVSTALAVLMDKGTQNEWHVAAIVLASTAYVAMLWAERKWGGLTIGFVAVASLVPIVAALGVMPRNGDLWSYAMYGRMLGVDHLSPWTHVPASFPHDPFRMLVGHSWSHTPSVYGPAFEAVSGVGAAVLGGSTLPTRLFYQSLAVLALGGGGLIVWRYTRSAAAVAFLTVHPLVVIYLVNPGRNDVLVGVALLAAVVLAARNRMRAAGAVGALGALVKVTGIVGVVAMLVTTAVARRRTATRRMAAAATVVFGGAYLAAGRDALLAPMQTAGALYSRASPWSILSALGLPQPSPHVPLAILACLVTVVIVRHARSAPGTAVAASSTTLALGASYTLPGYAAWGLPVAALDHRSRVSRIVAATGLVLLLTYEILRHPVPGTAGLVLRNLAGTGGPLLMIALLLALLHTRSGPEERTTVPTRTDDGDGGDVARDAPGVGPRVTFPAATFPSAPRTLVVLPTLDEAENIGTVLPAIRRSLPAADVLVVDDGSTDGTPEAAEAVARELGHITVLRRSGPKGLGPAYRAGFGQGLALGYDVLVEMDADLSHDPGALPSLVAPVLEGADLAIGSRYVAGGATPGWPARRRTLSRAGGTYARLLLGLGVQDVTSGFRAYRADLLRAVDLDRLDTTGYAFQIDMTDRARQTGAVIREVPIVFRDRTAGTSKMSGAIVGEALLLVTRRALRRTFRPRREQRATPTPTPEPAGADATARLAAGVGAGSSR